MAWLYALPAGRPFVIADNAGGGAPGDSSFVLRRLLGRAIGNVAIGAFWDLRALQICREAKAGAHVDLRIGGKSSRIRSVNYWPRVSDPWRTP